MEKLNVAKTKLTVGAEKPFKIMHITDAHICRAYESEGEKLTSLAQRRAERAFGGEENVERFFDEAVSYGRYNCDIIAYTGDIYDFLSQSNFDYMEKAFAEKDYIYAAGNHDFCTAPGADKEDTKFKMRQLKTVAPHIKNNLIFYSRVIKGVNLIAIDNSYYQFTEGQIAAFRAEAARGLPMLLFMHTPFYSKEQAEYIMRKGNCAYLAAPPEELLARYPKERADYQRATASTAHMFRTILAEPTVKAIFAGHTHENFDAVLEGGLPQYITGGTFRGEAREITVE